MHTGPVQGLTASTVTVATGGLEGAQIGVVNIAGPVTGAQLGVLNVAKEVDAAVGALASISWAHRIRAVAWLSSITPLQVGVQFEGKRMYAGISFGRLFQQILTEADFFLGAEIGLHAYANPEHGVIWDFAVSTDSSVGVGAGKLVDLVRLGTRFGYRVAPRTFAAPPASVAEAGRVDALYADAHRLHFDARDHEGALRAWDAYLQAAPAGRLAPEARYNRGLCLLHLGRVAEARTALAPIAGGAAGSYRQDEAARLLRALDDAAP